MCAVHVGTASHRGGGAVLRCLWPRRRDACHGALARAHRHLPLPAHLSVVMRNQITWGDNRDQEPCLGIDVNLEVTLEVYIKPLSLLPLCAQSH